MSAVSAPPATLIIEVSCEYCFRRPGPARSGDVFLEMRTKDETTCYLCPRCWLEELQSKHPRIVDHWRVLEGSRGP